jgi:hypothetical protein
VRTALTVCVTVLGLLLAAVAPGWGYPSTLLIHFDPPELTLHVDPDMALPADPEAVVAQEACPALAVQKVPLPVPWAIVWMTAAREGSAVYLDPKRAKRITGLLTRCPAAPTTQATR